MTRQAQTDAVFQRRIMRRVIPLIVITFLVLAILSIFALQSDGRRVLQQESAQIIVALDQVLEDELKNPVDELATIATSNTARNYARLYTGSQVVEIPIAQQERLRGDLLGLFDEFLTRNRDDFLSIRFLTPDGTVADEFVNTGGQSALNPQAQPDTLMTPDSFSQAILNPPGEVFLGPSTTATSEGTDTTDSLFLYTTVATVDSDSDIAGLLQLEISKQGIVSIFEDILSNPTFSRDGRRVILVNNQNAIIAQSGETHLEAQALQRFLTDHPGQQSQASATNNILVSTAEARISVSGEDTPWRIVVEDNLLQALTTTNNLSVAVAVGFILLTGVLLFAINTALRSVVSPLNQAADFAQRLAEKGKAREVAGMVRLPTPLARADDTELGQLVGAIGDISAHITQLNAALDSQMKRRNRDLDIAVHVERETASARDLDSTLTRILTLICEALGLYHAQIFLADDIGATLLLTHSRGKVGQRLIEKNIKISISSEMPVARAARLLKPEIVGEVSPNRTSDPYMLPETRSRIVVPLIVDNQMLGALDIQSNEATPLTSDDLPTFMLLGNQLANLVYRVRDVNNLNRQIVQMDALNRQLTRNAWEQTEEQSGLERTYQYNLMDVERLPVTPQELSGLSTPISVRGEVIGELNAHPTEGQAFTEGDALVLRAVAERVSLAIENARLFHETQTSLQETSTLYQLSRYLNEADTLRDVVQSIIYAVMPDAAGGQVWIFDEYGSTQSPRWMEIVADVNSVHRNPSDQDLTGLRLFVPDHPFINTMSNNQVTIITNLERDTRSGPGLKAVFERMQAQAIVIIPLTVRGVWRGLIALEYAAPREFSESEGRTFSALIDQAGVAIDNRLLLQQTENALTQNENLYAASRIINTAQNAQDLVYAAVATNTDTELSFSLSVLEGALDETGWPTQARVVAQSDGMTVKEMDFVHPIFIPPNSPMRVREPEIVSDIDPTDPDVPTSIKWIRSQGNRFMAVFPLFSANQPIALFQITSTELRELNAGDYDVYRALTGQMSSQLQIRRLLVSTEQALDETRRLYIASRSITSAQDSFMVYQAAIEHLARPLLQAGQQSQTVTMAVLLAWPDATPYAPYLEYVYNWSSEHDTNPASRIGQQLNSDEYPYGRLTEEAEGLIYFSDITRTAALGDPLNDEPHLREILLQQGAASVVVVPIQTRMKWFGVLITQSDQPNAFSEQYQRFLQAVTDQVSIAVENQRLFTEAQNEARRAQSEAQRAIALAEAAGLASRIGSDFRRSLGEVFERVAEEAGLDRWMLLLKTAESDNLLEKIIAVAPNYSLENDVRVVDLSTELPIVDAVRINRSLTVNAPAHYPAFRDRPAAELRAIEDFYGKHIVMPVTSLADSSDVLGSLMLGRGIDSEDLDERDEQLVAALAAQVAVALENRRLFDQTQTEQQTLRSILSTLPTGVLVLDAETLLPIQFNDQVETYLNRKIDPTQPFSSAAYNLYRTGTLLHYPQDEMPIFAALAQGRQVFQDDVAVIEDDLQTDLLVYAAPILDAQGGTSAIVAAFQDISNLRSLENTLQENLRETVALSESQRLLSEAAGLDEVMRITLQQLSTIAPTDAYVLLADDEGESITLGQALNQEPDLLTIHTLLDDLVIVRVGDSQTAFLDNAGRTTLEKLGMRDFISVPLRARSRPKPLGWLIVVST
ncbi:MAG: GAF domain-containing protein, partial [Chitinophagaceae bacterium]|nr:GAF domain-containing protein [Anaerolineae bacterium]